MGIGSKRFRNIVLCAGLGAIVGFGAVSERDAGFLHTGPAYAQEDWRKEFEDVCSKTQDAMVFSSEELSNLVGRCDKLKPQIEKLDESQRKVYLKRLKLCRDLYTFVLESKEKKR